MAGLLMGVYGAVTYVFFFLTFLYAIAFVDDLPFAPKTLDSGAQGALIPTLIVDARETGVGSSGADGDVGFGGAIGSTIRVAITGYSEPRLTRAVQRLGEIAPVGSAGALAMLRQGRCRCCR